MKKRVTAELISIAHRILKLKNHSETLQLQQEAKKLYEQLTVLRFYEENFEWVKDEISEEVLQSKLFDKKQLDLNEQNTGFLDVMEVNNLDKNIEHLETEKTEISSNVDFYKEQDTVLLEKSDEVKEVYKTSKKNEKLEIPNEKKKIKENIKNKETANQISFDDLLVHNYQELDFVKVEDVPINLIDNSESDFESTHDKVESEIIDLESLEKLENQEETNFETLAQEPFHKNNSLNDKLNSTITFGLNDRIGFEKKLFGGSSNDLNRVISQLNTFDSFEEAKAFVNDFVKPDYNNWEGAEEFEKRFMEIVEKKFN